MNEKKKIQEPVAETVPESVKSVWDRPVKVAIACPWWGRWEITQKHAKSIVRFIKESPSWVEISYHCVVSPEDKDHKELLDIAFNSGFQVSEYRNSPVSTKLNALINLVLDISKPDYIMNMGSDDLVSADIWPLYKPFIDRGANFFGIDSCHIIDFYQRKAMFMAIYNDRYPVGVLRMVRAEIIRNIWKYYQFNMYPSKIDRGMDAASMDRMNKVGIIAEVVHVEDQVLTAGLKCNTTINHWLHLSALPCAKEVPFDVVKKLLP